MPDIKERRLPDGKLIGYIDVGVFPFIIYDTKMRPIGKQISIEDASVLPESANL